MAQFLAGERGFSSLQSVQTSCGAHPNWYQLASGAFTWWYSGRDMKLISHFHLVLELYHQAKCYSKKANPFLHVGYNHAAVPFSVK